MKRYTNFTEFYQLLEQIGHFPEYNEHVSHFRNMILGLGGGCGCTRNARMEQINKMYLEMAKELGDLDKEHIKGFVGTDRVELANGEDVFCSF